MGNLVTTIRQLEVLAQIARKPVEGRVTRYIHRRGRKVAIIEFPDNNMVQTLIHKRLVRISDASPLAIATERGLRVSDASPLAIATERGLRELDAICGRIWPEAKEALENERVFTAMENPIKIRLPTFNRK